MENSVNMKIIDIRVQKINWKKLSLKEFTGDWLLTQSILNMMPEYFSFLRR